MTQENQVLYEDEIEQIDKVLTRLIKEAEAKCALLVDKDGHLITRQGFTHTLDTPPWRRYWRAVSLRPRRSPGWSGSRNFRSCFTRAKRTIFIFR